MRKTLLLVGACIFLASPISAQTPITVTATRASPWDRRWIVGGIPTAIGGANQVLGYCEGTNWAVAAK
jgi:hypothetical protein